MPPEFQSKMYIEIYWVLINVFWIRLRFFRNIFVRHRFVRYRLFVKKKHFVCLEDVLKMSLSSRHILKASSRRLQDVFKTCLEDVSKAISKRLAGCLQEVWKTSWKTKSCYTKDALNASSRMSFKKCVSCGEGGGGPEKANKNVQREEGQAYLNICSVK